MIVEIVILAMIAAFLGMRLYSVLGRRAEHEEEVVPNRFERGDNPSAHPPAAPPPMVEMPGSDARIAGFPPAIERGLREIAAADRTFDLLTFLEGAKSAYGMVLEAFWQGNKDDLKQLCDDDVYRSFASAIDEREKEGLTLQNRLIRIEDTSVHSASLNGHVASITVHFQADIAAITRDKDGNMVAGSLDDAIVTNDIWTFHRDLRSTAPDWLLDETDIG